MLGTPPTKGHMIGAIAGAILLFTPAIYDSTYHLLDDEAGSAYKQATIVVNEDFGGNWDKAYKELGLTWVPLHPRLLDTSNLEQLALKRKE